MAFAERLIGVKEGGESLSSTGTGAVGMQPAVHVQQLHPVHIVLHAVLFNRAHSHGMHQGKFAIHAGQYKSYRNASTTAA